MSRARWLLFVWLGGCASSSPPPEGSERGLPPGPFRAPPPCRSAEDCFAKGNAAVIVERDDARVLLDLACEKGSIEGCLELGKAYASGRAGPADTAAARKAFERICQAPRTSVECRSRPHGNLGYLATCVPDACAWLTDLSVSDERLAYARHGCSITGQDAADSRAARARACRLVADDAAASQRPVEARSAYQSACSLGDDAGCKIAMTPTASAATATAPVGTAGAPGSSGGAGPGATASTGATIEMPSVNTDGLVMRDVSCALEDDSPVIGLLGGLTIGAGFAPQKAALQRCSPGPFEAPISWRIERQRVAEITCSSKDARIKACVEKTLRGAPSLASGRCQATLVVGSKPAP